MILFFIPIISAEKKIVVQYREIENEIILENIYAIENNNFYLSKFFKINISEKKDYKIKLLDGTNNVIYESLANYPPDTEIQFNQNLMKSKKIVFEKQNGDILIQQNINLCNNNGICEPCLEKNCTNFENHLLCSDCSASIKDSFCNLKDDNICDPDCIWYTYDETCFESNLLDMTCEDNYLDTCEIDEICNEGLISSLDGLECCQSECFKKIKSIDEKIIELEENEEPEEKLEDLKNDESVEDDNIEELEENNESNDEINDTTTLHESNEKEDGKIIYDENKGQDEKNSDNQNKNNKSNSSIIPSIILILIIITIIISLIFIIKKRNNNQNNNNGNNNNEIYNNLENNNENNQINNVVEDQVSLEEQYRRNNYGNQYNKK